VKDVADIPVKSALYKAVTPHCEVLLTGTVLVIDPSIGSSSSAPGWAVYENSQLHGAGTIDTGGSHLPLWQRARNLADEIRALCDDYAPTLLVYEDIPATSGFNANAQASLLKAVGIVLAASTTDDCLGVHPASWKNYVRATYNKGDEEDAIEIGYIVTQLARRIQQATRDDSGTRRTVSHRGNKGK
jgi:Holliday junction resolvasome RuvABC endonuclease subunit